MAEMVESANKKEENIENEHKMADYFWTYYSYSSFVSSWKNKFYRSMESYCSGK